MNDSIGTALWVELVLPFSTETYIAMMADVEARIATRKRYSICLRQLTFRFIREDDDQRGRIPHPPLVLGWS